MSDHFYGLQRQRDVGRDLWVADDDTAAHADAIAANLEANFIATDWFDQELRTVTGIDVYTAPFPRHEGVRSYRAGRFRRPCRSEPRI